MILDVMNQMLSVPVSTLKWLPGTSCPLPVSLLSPHPRSPGSLCPSSDHHLLVPLTKQPFPGPFAFMGAWEAFLLAPLQAVSFHNLGTGSSITSGRGPPWPFHTVASVLSRLIIFTAIIPRASAVMYLFLRLFSMSLATT